MSERKLYSIAEANALLPYLAPTLVELREKFEKAAEIRKVVAEIGSGNGWSADREDWSTTLARVAELLGRLEEWQLELRDVMTGLIDFPARMHGEDAYLCWRLGEPEVAYWHTPEAGFGGRTPL